MNLILSRQTVDTNGIFGTLLMLDGTAVCETLEHNFDGCAALPLGVYPCVRGWHRLHPEQEVFETFEVTGVPGHTGILFHCGNQNADSRGCVLLGTWTHHDHGSPDAIEGSRDAFARFMGYQTAVDHFTLTVQES
jgi:hypothetical protein